MLYSEQIYNKVLILEKFKFYFYRYCKIYDKIWVFIQTDHFAENFSQNASN